LQPKRLLKVFVLLSLSKEGREVKLKNSMRKIVR
jgi:hypothetical protein